MAATVYERETCLHPAVQMGNGEDKAWCKLVNDKHCIYIHVPDNATHLNFFEKKRYIFLESLGCLS